MLDLFSVNWGLPYIVDRNVQLIYLREVTVPDVDQAIWRRLWCRILVVSQSCNRGLAFPTTQMTSQISDRRAGRQAQHPGANLQSYGLDEALVKVMESQVGLLIEKYWVLPWGERALGNADWGAMADCLLGVMETADWGVTGTVVWLSVRQTLDCKGQLLFQLPRCAPH